MQNQLTYKELEEKVISLEKKLKLSEEHKNFDSKCELFVQTLLDTIPSPIFYKDIDGVYRNCNDSFSDVILGIPKEKIINKSLFDLPDYIPYELAEIYYKKDQVLFNNPGTQIYQGAVKCSNGETRQFTFYKATVNDDNNNIIGLVGVMLDVTELENKKIELNENINLLEELSFTDSLTNLYNRRKFNEIFTAFLNSPKQDHSILNFAILDVDNFKAYNDKYGHLEGDTSLKTISDSLKSYMIQANDFAFRLGGEEFGLLYYTKDAKTGFELADKIRKNIEKIKIKTNNTDSFTNVTISLGLISIKNNLNHEDKIYEEADNLLYQAKNSGKNKVLSKEL